MVSELEQVQADDFYFGLEEVGRSLEGLGVFSLVKVAQVLVLQLLFGVMLPLVTHVLLQA